MICPVCCYQILTTKDYMESFLMEEHGACQCGYVYEYMTGSQMEAVGPWVFYENYLGNKGRDTFLPFAVAVILWRVWWYVRSLF